VEETKRNVDANFRAAVKSAVPLDDRRKFVFDEGANDLGSESLADRSRLEAGSVVRNDDPQRRGFPRRRDRHRSLVNVFEAVFDRVRDELGEDDREGSRKFGREFPERSDNCWADDGSARAGDFGGEGRDAFSDLIEIHGLSQPGGEGVVDDGDRLDVCRLFFTR